MNATEQFWASEFGNEYIDRNNSKSLLAANIHMFGKILSHTRGIESVIELGANVGMNLDAIHSLLPDVELTGLEINQTAFDIMLKKPSVRSGIFASLLQWYPQRKWDMAFTKGVLIHIAPENLTVAYQNIYNASSKYILIAEYYNQTPVEIDYRGHKGRLWKRDFCGDILKRFMDLRLIAAGFEYRRSQWPQDDITWFLLEKTK